MTRNFRERHTKGWGAAAAFVAGVMALAATSFAQGVEAPAPPGVEAGKVVEIRLDRSSGVTSAWLANGVLVHHKLLKAERGNEGEEKTGEARRRPAPSLAVCITVAGAELLETAENRGVSDAAVAAAWNARSVRSMQPGELAKTLDAAGVSIRCYGGGDAFMLTATAEAGKLDDALRAARLLLTEPVVDASELAAWQERTIKAIDERESQGNDAFEGVIAALFGPQEARARRPQAQTIRAVTREQAQAWLDGALGIGAGEGAAPKPMPMEVAITGDISVDRAIALAEAHLGSLPPRERIGAATLAERRVATRAERPPGVLELPNWKGPALVLVGFFGADIADIGDHRALAVAARIMNGRLDRLPSEQHDAEQAFAMATPASVYPGFGLFLASTRAKEGSEAAAGENIGKLLADLMESGPSAEELSEASQELSNGATKATSDPVYWARALSRSAYHGFPLAEIGRAPAAYREMPADGVKGALRKYFTPERSIRLIVKPPPTPSPAAPKPEEPAER